MADKPVELLEQAGSKVYWQQLDDAEYDKPLRLKIVEESEEVLNAHSKTDLINELADVMDIIQALCAVNKITIDDIFTAQHNKHAERGGFESRKFVTIAAHQEGSFGEKYCLADPTKYPEIKDQE